jgi:hypothetical protein
MRVPSLPSFLSEANLCLAPRGESDCVGSQGNRVAHRVHRLWGPRKDPACGLVGNPVIYTVTTHGGLQGELALSIALRMTSSLRIAAMMATLAGLPAARSRR